MKTRTLLIDGSYLFKRSINGAKDLYTNSFGQISGLYQSLTKIRSLIKQFSINMIIIAYDGEQSGKLRHMLDHNYKANRKSKSWYSKIQLSDAEIKREQEKEESALKQRKRFQSYCEELFIRQIEIDEIEGDDVIASYCLKHNNDRELYIFSRDFDYAQLLDLNISIIFPNIDEPVTKQNFYFKFGYHYSNVLTMKIICGDTSDNIKGIEGLGETLLLKYFPEMEFEYMSVREICKKAKIINEDRIKEKKKPLKCFENLLNNIERLKLNYKLINLKEPFLNNEAIDALEQLDMPLSPENRGSKNLYKMMIEDEFLTIYNGTFVNYVEPFYTVIMYEKKLLENYYKNLKNS